MEYKNKYCFQTFFFFWVTDAFRQRTLCSYHIMLLFNRTYVRVTVWNLFKNNYDSVWRYKYVKFKLSASRMKTKKEYN
jgi:hypothetical protein